MITPNTNESPESYFIRLMLNEAQNRTALIQEQINKNPQLTYQDIAPTDFNIARMANKYTDQSWSQYLTTIQLPDALNQTDAFILEDNQTMCDLIACQKYTNAQKSIIENFNFNQLKSEFQKLYSELTKTNSDWPSEIPGLENSLRSAFEHYLNAVISAQINSPQRDYVVNFLNTIQNIQKDKNTPLTDIWGMDPDPDSPTGPHSMQVYSTASMFPDPINAAKSIQRQLDTNIPLFVTDTNKQIEIINVVVKDRFKNLTEDDAAVILEMIMNYKDNHKIYAALIDAITYQGAQKIPQLTQEISMDERKSLQPPIIALIRLIANQPANKHKPFMLDVAKALAIKELQTTSTSPPKPSRSMTTGFKNTTSKLTALTKEINSSNELSDLMAILTKAHNTNIQQTNETKNPAIERAFFAVSELSHHRENQENIHTLKRKRSTS